jgi:hypothetical protein
MPAAAASISVGVVGCVNQTFPDFRSSRVRGAMVLRRRMCNAPCRDFATLSLEHIQAVIALDDATDGGDVGA